MMRFTLKFAAVIWALAFAVSATTPLPRWVRDRIARIEKENPNEQLEVSKWLFEGKTVYVFPARCCDIAGEVLSLKGEHICQLEGGFANAPDERCRDFRDRAKMIESVWKSKPKP
jgi:hypothetical protein